MFSNKPWRQAHWVGDLTLAFDVEVASVNEVGGLVIELVKAGVSNRCEFDLTNDTVSLWHGETRLAEPAPLKLKAQGRRSIRFANVDDRLTVRVDGESPFGDGVSFDPGEAVAPTAADLSPVGITARGAVATLSGLSLKRDIYYTLQPGQSDYDSLALENPLPTDPVAVYDWLADPSNFSAFAKLGPRDFPIAPGRYMMFGDNSPWSRDGRDWRRTDQTDPSRPDSGWDSSGRESWEVPESLLVGKAFCVYWPHFQPIWPNLRFGRDLRLPAVPNFWEMRWVR
jgi:signal peptidase I